MTAALSVAGGGGMADLAVGVGVGIAGAAGARIPAMIRCMDPAALGLVLFDFNPQAITFTRQGKGRNRPSVGPGTGTPTGGTGKINSYVTPPTITINDIIFEGQTTKFRCDYLLDWMSPPHGLLAAGAALLGLPVSSAPPTLTFQWGPPMLGFMYEVLITTCKINYERFSSIGIPLRAKLSLTMEQQPSLLGSLPTNPTSGGLPGRRRHVVAEGETLYSIATTYYGRPGLWRRIAEVNGIQDPSRVRAGTNVYLPNFTEVAAGSAS